MKHIKRQQIHANVPKNRHIIVPIQLLKTDFQYKIKFSSPVTLVTFLVLSYFSELDRFSQDFEQHSVALTWWQPGKLAS